MEKKILAASSMLSRCGDRDIFFLEEWVKAQLHDLGRWRDRRAPAPALARATTT